MFLFLIFDILWLSQPLHTRCVLKKKEQLVGHQLFSHNAMQIGCCEKASLSDPGCFSNLPLVPSIVCQTRSKWWNNNLKATYGKLFYPVWQLKHVVWNDWVPSGAKTDLLCKGGVLYVLFLVCSLLKLSGKTTRHYWTKWIGREKKKMLGKTAAHRKQQQQQLWQQH